MHTHLNASYLEARVSIQRAYLHASREAAAGWRHDNGAVFEWSMKIGRSTSTFLSRFHKPCRPRHFAVQVLRRCNYVPGIPLGDGGELKITHRPMHAEQSTRNKGTFSHCKPRDQRKRTRYRTARAEPKMCEPKCSGTHAPPALRDDQRSQLTPPHCSRGAFFVRTW